MKIDSFPKLIDITSLIGQRIAGKRSTGIDRVNLAYVQRYHRDARALICYRGHWLYFMNWATYRNSILFKIDYFGLEKINYANVIIRKKLRPVYFLHDLLPLAHSEHFVSKAHIKHHQCLTTMMNTACGLILNSEDTRQNLIIYAKKHRLSLPQLLVAPLGT